jgi:hypothetical protein
LVNSDERVPTPEEHERQGNGQQDQQSCTGSHPRRAESQGPFRISYLTGRNGSDHIFYVDPLDRRLDVVVEL